MTNETIEKFDTLEALLTDQTDEWLNSSKNTVRFEFFLTSNLRNARCDMHLPVADPWHLMSAIDHAQFQKCFNDCSETYLTPLSNFIEELRAIESDSQGLDVFQPSKMSSGIRTTLVFCSEKCVQAANTIGCQGKITQLLWKELRKGDNYQVVPNYFVLPSSAMVPVVGPDEVKFALKKPRMVVPTVAQNAASLPESAEDRLLGPNCCQEGEHYAVNPLMLLLEGPQPGGSRVAESLLRKPPQFLQPARGKLNPVLNLPSAFFRFSSQMHMLTLKACDPPGMDIQHGVFEEPDYDRLSLLSKLEAEALLEELAMIIWKAYDVEWWFIIKARSFNRRKETNWAGHDNVPLALEDFPATLDEHTTWTADQMMMPLLKTSSKFSNGIPEICDLGEPAG
jgi:hypothetical protein